MRIPVDDGRVLRFGFTRQFPADESFRHLRRIRSFTDAIGPPGQAARVDHRSPERLHDNFDAADDLRDEAGS